MVHSKGSLPRLRNAALGSPPVSAYPGEFELEAMALVPVACSSVAKKHSRTAGSLCLAGLT